MSYEDNFSQPGSLNSSAASILPKPNSDSSEHTTLDHNEVVKRSYAYEDNSSLASDLASDYVPDDETAQKLSTGLNSETSSEYSSSSYKLNDYETDETLSQATAPVNKPIQFEKNWNEEFQQLLEVKEGSDDESTDKFRKLAELAHDFCYAAQIYGKIIISEVGLPREQKTIKPVDVGGRAGGDKYMVLNILFKFALDTEGLYGNDDAAAMKAANHELKGLMNYYNCHVPGISFPLMALINYRGYRLVAISLLPIDKSTIIYGSHDGGQHVHAKRPEFNQKMIEAAKMLNLKGHIVGIQNKVMLYSAGDIEGHLGRDNRYYLIDFARVFPPQLKLVKDWKPRQLYELLRPELVQSNPVPLSSDALTGWGSQDKENHLTHNKEVKDATLRLFVENIPKFAAEVEKLTPAELANYRLTEELHRNGINIRHLGHIRKQVKNPDVRKKILHICIARTMKDKISTKLRKKVREIRIPSEEPYKKVILNYLNKVLDTKSSFWTKKIKHQMQEKFPECLSEVELDVKGDLKISSLDIYELIQYFQSLTGVKMSTTALEELKANPHSFRFVSTDLRLMEATVKHMNLIEHCSAVVLHSEAIKSQGREASRLFTLANEKFREAQARAPNSVMTLFHWGKLLHAMALRFFDPSLVFRSRNSDRLPRLISNTRNLLPQPPKNGKVKFGEKYALYNSESSLPIDEMLTGSEISASEGDSPSMRSLSNSSNSAQTLSNSQFARFSLERSRNYNNPDDISLGDERRKFVDMDKAEEYFMLAEEKFRRAIQLSANFRPAKESLTSLLYDFGDFLLESGKIKPFYQVREIYEKATQKFSDLLNYDPTIYQSLYRKARQYTSMFKKVDDFKSQSDHYNAAATLFRALKKRDKTNEVLNFKYGLLMFRYYVACLKKDQITEDTKTLINKAAKSLVRAGKSNPKIVQQISSKIFGREFDSVKDFSSHLNYELFGLVDIGVFLTDINSAFKEKFDSIRRLNLTGMFKNLESNEEAKFQNIFKVCGNLTHLILDECKITDETMKFIGRYVPKLEHLSCRGCKQITMICITENERTKRMLMNSVSSNPEGVAAQRMVNSNANLLANLATTPTTPPSMHVTSPRERTTTLPVTSTSPQSSSNKKKRDPALAESAPEPDVISLLNSMNNVKTKKDKDKASSKSPRDKERDKSPKGDKNDRSSISHSTPNALNLSAMSTKTNDKTSPLSSPRDHKGNQQVSPRAMLGSQRVASAPTPSTNTNVTSSSNNNNVQKVELDAIMRAAGNVLSSSVKTLVEEKFEKDKHDKEKDKHDKDKEKDKHERRLSREAERSEREPSVRSSRASLLSDPLARLGTSAVTEFIPKHQYPVKSWYFPPDLTYLDLSNCPLLDSDWIATISYFTKLTYLSLAGDNKLMDDALIPVIYNCTKLSSLNVNDCHLLTSYSIQFLTKTPHLTELSMGNCKNVYEDCIQQISRTCSQLVSLDISNIKDISDSTVKNIASKCPNLTTLKLSFCSQITDSSIKSLAKSVGKHLIELDLTSCLHLTDQSILAVAKVASKMRRLVLRQCSEITGASMLELAKNCPDLEKLDISNCHRIDTIIEVLASCNKLSDLNMESCFGLGFDCLKNLNKKLPALVNFNWSQGNASNESLKVVAVCMPNVEILQFNQCKKVTDQGVHYLANLQNVKEMYLDNTSITDAAIKSLAEGGSANTISVLSLQNPEKLTDESLDLMSKQFKVLKHLSISSNDLTDQAIEKLLLGCRELHELFIKNNILSKKAVHGLRDKFPNVKLLVHTTLNIKPRNIERI